MCEARATPSSVRFGSSRKHSEADMAPTVSETLPHTGRSPTPADRANGGNPGDTHQLGRRSTVWRRRLSLWTT